MESKDSDTYFFNYYKQSQKTNDKQKGNTCNSIHTVEGLPL